MTIIRVKEKVATETEIDVQFPVFARHDIDGDTWTNTIYSRLDADGSRFAITLRSDGGIDLEPSRIGFQFPLTEPDYLLGRGEFKSNAAEFYYAVDEVQKAIDNFRANRSADG